MKFMTFGFRGGGQAPKLSMARRHSVLLLGIAEFGLAPGSGAGLADVGRGGIPSLPKRAATTALSPSARDHLRRHRHRLFRPPTPRTG